MSQSKFFSNDGYPTSRSTEMSLGDMHARIFSQELTVPSYQRKYVWSKRQQDQYLDSLRNNLPLSGAVINIDVDAEQSVMDGQNRLWTIYKYMVGEISFTDEDENVWWFSDLEDSEKRKFKNKKFAYTETSDWSTEQCQNFFSVIQGGTPLKPGEKIHGKPENPLTMAIIHILSTFDRVFKCAGNDGGVGLTDSSKKRYGHYEVVGTIINMVRSGSYPVRPGKTALTEFHHWSDDSPTRPSSEEKEDCIALVIELLQRYSLMIINVPTLRGKMKIGQHLRLMYFIFNSGIYKDNPDSQYFKIDRLLNKVLNKENPEHILITKWGTTSVDKIYDLYLEIYESV